jgi:hypothetical protein
MIKNPYTQIEKLNWEPSGISTFGVVGYTLNMETNTVAMPMGMHTTFLGWNGPYWAYSITRNITTLLFSSGTCLPTYLPTYLPTISMKFPKKLKLLLLDSTACTTLYPIMKPAIQTRPHLLTSTATMNPPLQPLLFSFLFIYLFIYFSNEKLLSVVCLEVLLPPNQSIHPSIHLSIHPSSLNFLHVCVTTQSIVGIL